MAKKNRAAILGLVDKAWGLAGSGTPTEESIGGQASVGNQEINQQARGSGGKAPGYGARKGVRKPAPRPPRRPGRP